MGRMKISCRIQTSVRALAIVFALSFAGRAAHAGTITDDFSSDHDYSSRDVTGTIWDGVMFNNGFDGTQTNTIVSADANTSSSGSLTLASSGGNWGGTSDNGFFLFVNVSGDFSATLQVISAVSPNYNDFGLMARAINIADGGMGEDYVAGRYFGAGGFNALRSNDDDFETDFNQAGLHAYLKLERVGNLFTFTSADDSAFTLNVASDSILRDDLNGLPLQVGIWQATYTDNVGTAVVDNFSLTTSVVPEPSSIVLALFGGLGALALLRRRRIA